MKHTKNALMVAVLLVSTASAWAKLPAPSDEAKAKAAETAAKTAWSGKVDGYLLCKAQDRTAQHYKKSKGEAKPAAPAKPAATATPAAPAAPAAPCVDPGPFVYVPAVAAVAPAAAPAAAVAAAPAAAASKP